MSDETAAAVRSKITPVIEKQLTNTFGIDSGGVLAEEVTGELMNLQAVADGVPPTAAQVQTAVSSAVAKATANGGADAFVIGEAAESLGATGLKQVAGRLALDLGEALK
jgi:hypothetical protein